MPAEHIQRDWEDRLFTENLSTQIKRVADFLNKFDVASRDKLAKINEKIIRLERQVTYLERVNGSITASEVFEEEGDVQEEG